MFDLFNHLARRERIASDAVLSRIWDRNLIVDEVNKARERLRAEEAKLAIFDTLGEQQ
jgi:hypothetical protein